LFDSTLEIGKDSTVKVKLDRDEIKQNLETYLNGLEDWIKVIILSKFDLRTKRSEQSYTSDYKGQLLFWTLQRSWPETCLVLPSYEQISAIV
jgi:hypothetical protein